jgi:hypothetical protein
MSRFSRIVNVEDMKITALDNVPGKSIAASFVAKTFIYTGEEPGAQSAEGAPGAAPGAPAGKAGANAQTLKGRAEGGGVE